MAVLHADDFKGYGTTVSLLLNGVYVNCTGSLLSDPDPSASAGSMCFKSSIPGNTQNIRWALPASGNTVGVATRIWIPTLASTTNYAPRPIQFRTTGNVAICDLRVDTNGQLQVLNSANTQIAASVGPAITANAWWHIEMRVDIAGASSVVEVRVEGVTVIGPSTVDLGSTSIAQVASGNSSGTVTQFYLKDYVVWDGTGSQNNDFLGSVLVEAMVPTSDSSFPTGWTSTDANGYSVLDNDPPDDVSHYISADASPPSPAEFGLSNLPADITSVKALVTRVRAAKSDGGDGSLQVSLLSGASVDDGSDRPITTAQTYWSDVSELDPATSTAWTPVSANAAVLRLTRTT